MKGFSTKDRFRLISKFDQSINWDRSEVAQEKYQHGDQPKLRFFDGKKPTYWIVRPLDPFDETVAYDLTPVVRGKFLNVAYLYSRLAVSLCKVENLCDFPELQWEETEVGRIVTLESLRQLDHDVVIDLATQAQDLMQIEDVVKKKSECESDPKTQITSIGSIAKNVQNPIV